MARKFSDWYAENKDAISTRRKADYAADPAKRLAAQEYQRDYRTRVGGGPVQFQGLTRAELCDNLDITPWVLNSWRNKGFYPEPAKIAGKVSFTEQQLSLIGLLAEFHRNTGPRLSPQQKTELSNIVMVIQHNWGL